MMQFFILKTSFKNVVLRSILAILLGVVLIIWKDVALQYSVMLVGAFFLVTGLTSFIASYQKFREAAKVNALHPINGIGSSLLGLLLMLAPLFFARVLMSIMGAMFVFGAITQYMSLTATKQMPKASYLFPTAVLIAGIVVIFLPQDSAKLIIVLLGCTAIFYGLTELIGKYKIKKLREKFEQSHNMSGETTVDTEYEEV
ncbi:membrane protein [Bacteroidia bacterium]|nr:membrane protein [Bacteroidia bacterium]